MRSSWKTIALHFCARPKGNRKLRYLLESHPSSLPLSLQPLSFLTDFSLSLCSPPLSRALRAPPVSLLSIRNGSCFSPGDVEVCNPRMQPAPRTEGAGVSVRFAKREGQTERSIVQFQGVEGCFGRTPVLERQSFFQRGSTSTRGTVHSV